MKQDYYNTCQLQTKLGIHQQLEQLWLSQLIQMKVKHPTYPLSADLDS